MVPESIKDKTVCIVGLGYVGLPLAEAFSMHINTIGYRRNQKAVDELNELNWPNFFATTDPSYIKNADFVIICVPTPVTKNKMPDLNPIINATETVGRNLKQGAIVVGESTVWPGLTEEIMIPILERESGFKCGTDFKIGYSPERVNPGDSVHTTDRITKVVSGMDPETTDILCELYSLVTTVFPAKDIKTAEAAKIIENIQRDLNIALFNELAIIFHRMNLDIHAVTEAASTKWNFVPFKPGMVGGHCIPVDPYYLVHKAKELGYHSKVITAGREINDTMPDYVAMMTIKGLNKCEKVISNSKVLIMGLTYKANVADTRETPVAKLISILKEFDIDIYGYDPLLSPDKIAKFGIKPTEFLEDGMDAVILTVAHDDFKNITLDILKKSMRENPLIIDIKRIFDNKYAQEIGIDYMTL